MKLLNSIFDSKGLNMILKINIMVYISVFLFTMLSNSFGNVIVNILAIHNNIGYDINLPTKFITHGFLHQEFNHILGNMITIIINYWIFNKIDDKKIWLIYLTSVLFSGLAFIFANFILNNNMEIILLGASGGICGLLSYSYIRYNKSFINIKFLKINIQYIHFIYFYVVINVIM